MKPQPKIKRIVDKKYTDWIKKKPCVTLHRLFSGWGGIPLPEDDIVPAHQNVLGGVMGGKTHDVLVVPMCASFHLGATVSDHNDPAKLWEDTDRPRLILSYITEYASETGKTINGMDFNLWLLKTIIENWEV